MFNWGKNFIIAYSIILLGVISIKDLKKNKEKSWDMVLTIPTLILLLNLI